MNEKPEFEDRAIAYALLRIFLGVNIALRGITRVQQLSKFRAAIETQFAHAPLPHAALVAFALALPWAESLIGLLILGGLWTRRALICGASLMILLTFGTCLIQDWQVAGIQLVYQLAYFILVFLHKYDCWSADAFLHRISGSDQLKRASA